MNIYPFFRLTIRQRLPFLITLLMLSIVLVFGIISYLFVRKVTLQVGENRLQTSSQQLSDLLSGNAYNLVTTAHMEANKPAIKAYVLSDGKDSTKAVQEVFRELQKDTSCFGWALLDTNLNFLHATGKPNRESLMASFQHFGATRSEPGVIGQLYSIGDSICFPVIAVISENSRLIGYLAKWRHMQTRLSTVNQIAKLIGAEAKLYVGNIDGTLWSNFVRPIPAPSTDSTNCNILQYSRSGNSFLATSCLIANSQWRVLVESPKSRLLQTANNYVYWLLLSALILIIAGIAIGLIMSRNISKPLVQLTSAASRIASGDHSSLPVSIGRRDEVGKLARSFNAMSVQLQQSKNELETEANNYKLLFEKNPLPMWIVSMPGLDFMDVNHAALRHYGYSKDEFLRLNSRDIRPAEEVDKFISSILVELKGDQHRATWRHKKKDGTVILVDVFANDIVYKGKPARIVLANDITEKVKAEAAILKQRLLQQKIITETTILVQEKEREEIGKELHDNINQILTSTKLYLELAKNGNKELLVNAVSRSYNNINLVIGEIRKLSKQLVKPAFDTSLEESLRDMTEELQAIGPLNIGFCCLGFTEDLVDESIKLMIYRVVQEQLNNILKHADANRVDIALYTDTENVYLTVTDDGIGFDTSVKSRGIGLRNIEHRVKFHKGSVVIESNRGEGCTIRISAPFRKETLATEREV
jgi:PAS domain S-box-containing protein